MARDADDTSMALFCDFENIALGVRDAQYEKFDIKPVLERLLLKGSIVVKKAYCDWDRYKSFKGAMHEANFELIEIPHVRQSGKNSADIRMVVDALDLCYTKSHVNTFVIISGDSDFSPLVSKLRENAKRVIGVGVKQSTSDLLIANCDEFIYVDDLVRKRQRDNSERQNRRSTVEPQDQDGRRMKGITMAVATLEALLEDRADDERVWASVVKEALKRRHPGFNEAYHGYKSFGALLEDAHRRGLLEFGRDEKSGAYVKRRVGAVVQPQEMPSESSVSDETNAVPADPAVAPIADVALEGAAAVNIAVPPAPIIEGAGTSVAIEDGPPAADVKNNRSRRSRGGRRGKPAATTELPLTAEAIEQPAVHAATLPMPVETAPAADGEVPPEPRRSGRGKPRTAHSNASAAGPAKDVAAGKAAVAARKPRGPRTKQSSKPQE